MFGENMKIDVEVYITSNEIHFQQIFTGLYLLKRAGVISLKEKIVKKNDLSRREKEILIAKVNKESVIVFDMWDGWQLNMEAYHTSDYYFKRSYAPHLLGRDIINSGKVYPYGLNYLVFPPFINFPLIKRSFYFDYFKRKIYYFLNAMNLNTEKWAAQSTLHIRKAYNINKKNKVIFITRTWSKEDVEEEYPEGYLSQITEFRAECIDKLKRTLKGKFYGGFIPTHYAKKKYPHLIVPNEYLTKRGRYLRLLNQFSIGIATEGLRGSIGCKVGEYVAKGMVIVTERLKYTVPGDFAEGNNYLSYSDIQQCVYQVKHLLKDPEMIRKIMYHNEIYYKKYLEPSMMIMNILNIVLNR